MNDKLNRYGLVSRINHWGAAIIILALLIVGLYFHEMPKGDERFYWMGIHIGLGTLSFLFLMFRIAWRFMATSPQLPDVDVLQGKIIRTGHRLLLASLFILMISGPLIVWTAGKPIDVFGWFAIPAPPLHMPVLHEFLEEGHALVSRIMMFLIAGHVAAAIWHLGRDKARWAGRMLGTRA
jgi:cytochrome b561